eukprot:scaffold6231_cov108-Cylindrotheca_fusiformis.AAC.7
MMMTTTKMTKRWNQEILPPSTPIPQQWRCTICRQTIEAISSEVMDDLATDTLFSSSVEHPNIIKLRGKAQETSARLLEWKKQKKRVRWIMGRFIMGRNGGEKKRLSLTAAYDIY